MKGREHGGKVDGEDVGMSWARFRDEWSGAQIGCSGPARSAGMSDGR